MAWNQNIELILRVALIRCGARDIDASLFHLHNMLDMIDENQKYLDAGYSLYELLGDTVLNESDEFTRAMTGDEQS